MSDADLVKGVGQRLRAMVLLPEPEGPTIRPIFQGLAPRSMATCQVSLLDFPREVEHALHLHDAGRLLDGRFDGDGGVNWHGVPGRKCGWLCRPGGAICP